MQDRWCQILQQSQQTPSLDQVTGLSHSPHGNMFALVGPGFNSMSPASRMIRMEVVVFGYIDPGCVIGLFLQYDSLGFSMLVIFC